MPALVETSFLPESKRPRLRGLGRYSLAFSSNASLTTSANDTPRSRARSCSRFTVFSSAMIVVRFMTALYKLCNRHRQVLRIVGRG
jgi:hypothetical protein